MTEMAYYRELQETWKSFNVRSSIKVINAIKPGELDNSKACKLIEDTMGYYEGDGVSDIQLEILRLYLNKQARPKV